MPQTEIYTIFCVVVGENTGFPIKIESSKTVGFLKKTIWEERKNTFANIDAAQLDLYHVEIPDNEDMAMVVEQNLLGPKLSPRTNLAEVFEDGTKRTNFIIVQPPKSGTQATETDRPKVVKFVDAVKFFTETLATHTAADLGDVSNDTHLHKGAHVASTPFPDNLLSNGHQIPSFVSVYLGKLDGKRPALQTQLQRLPEIFNQTMCEDHFGAPGPEEREMSSIELDTYTTHLRSHHYRLSTIRERSSTFKGGHVTVFLVDPALTDDDDEAWRYDKIDHAMIFKPRSDFSLVKATYGPMILGEIVSDDAEFDRWTMLFEAIAVCRYQNMIREDREAITLCLYLNKAYEIERYLVYQDADTNTRDVHVLHDLTLDLAKVQDAFLLSKQLFNFRQHLVQIPEKVESRRKEVLIIQEEIKRIYLASVTGARQLKSEASRSSRAPARTLGPITQDAVLQASFKAICNLFRVHKDVATAIQRSDMQSVILKRVRTSSSESHILRLLQSVGGSNHIISLLDIIEQRPDISTFVMPHYTPILNFKIGQVEDLALQLIRGVDWLHGHLISHSDIKETNLVFDERQNYLFIIDFGLAIKLTSREQKVRGARGTPEQVAPEVGITTSWENYLEEVFLDEDFIYNPILADVWAVGEVINYFCTRYRSSTEKILTVVEKVAKELQAVDPIERLSLHEAEKQIAAAIDPLGLV